MAIAPATPAMLPVPTRAEAVTVKAWKAERDRVRPFSSLVALSVMDRNISGRWRIWTSPVRTDR